MNLKIQQKTPISKKKKVSKQSFWAKAKRVHEGWQCILKQCPIMMRILIIQHMF